MRALDHLLTLLTNQQDGLTRLLELIRDERTCIMNSRIDELEAIIQEQSTLLTRQTALSAGISRNLALLGEELQLDGRVTLSRVAEQIAEPAAHQLQAFCQELPSLAETVQHEGRVNWHLAQQALKYIDFTFKLIGRAKEGPLLYQPPTLNGQNKSIQLLMDHCA